MVDVIAGTQDHMVTSDDRSNMRSTLAVTAIAGAALLINSCSLWFDYDSALPAGASGLRGVPADRTFCPSAQRDFETMPTPTVLVDNPNALVVCSRDGLDTPEGATPAGVRLIHGMPEFDELITTLSTPDEPRTEEICLQYADGPVFIYTSTDQGTFRLAMPVDSCGHYQDEVWRTVRPFTEFVR